VTVRGEKEREKSTSSFYSLGLYEEKKKAVVKGLEKKKEKRGIGEVSAATRALSGL